MLFFTADVPLNMWSFDLLLKQSTVAFFCWKPIDTKLHYAWITLHYIIFVCCVNSWSDPEQYKFLQYI